MAEKEEVTAVIGDSSKSSFALPEYISPAAECSTHNGQ